LLLVISFVVDVFIVGSSSDSCESDGGSAVDEEEGGIPGGSGLNPGGS
jgi:hypothetical protein